MAAIGDSEGEGCAQDLTPTETDRLRSLLDRIGDLQKYVQLTEWVIDVTEEVDEDDPTDKTRKLRARPVFVGLFARELLFSKARQTLAMSATILSHKIWAKNLGIAQSSLGYVDIPSSFPVKNRPIHLEYAGDMAWDKIEATLPRLYQTISRILERHKNQRGIVHTHSERLCRLICEQIDHPRILHLDMFPYRDKTKLLEAHTKRPDSVIVASGFHEGVDLKDELARFQVICKVPWPPMQDPLVKARMNVDGSYMPYQTALKLVQSYGRINRHDADHGTTYITDAGFERFQKRCGWLLPKWFTDAIQRPR
jgi:Rad3-related DNA helicase